MNRYYGVICCLLLTCMAGAQILIGDIPWLTDYQQARVRARGEQRWIWVHFGENPG